MLRSITATAILLWILVVAIEASAPISEVRASNEANATQELVSNWSTYQVIFDGKITNEAEWSHASNQTIVLFRRDLSRGDLLANDSLRATYYVKNDAEWLYLLVHVNSSKRPYYTDISLLWPVYHGFWLYSDLSGIDVGNRTTDAYGWNETRWQYDEPNNVKGAVSCSASNVRDCWFEYAKMLRSGDEHDWGLNAGDTVGGSPPDLLVGIWFGEEGGLYQRYLRLYLASGDFPAFFGPVTSSAAVFEMPPHSSVYSLSLDGNGSLIAVGLRNPAEVRVYTRNGSLVWRRPVGNSWAAYSVALSADGKFLAVGGDSSLELYSINGTRLWLKNLKSVYSVAVTSGGEKVLYSSRRGLGLVNQQGNYIWVDKPASVIGGVSMTSDGRYFAAVVEDRFYPIDVGARLFLYNSTGGLLWYRRLPEIVSFVGSRYSAPAMSNGANLIAVLGEGGKLVVFDHEGNMVWVRDSGWISIPAFGDRLVAMPSDNRYIAASLGGADYGSADVHLFSPNGSDWGSLRIQQENYGFGTIGTSPDGGYIAGGGYTAGHAVVDLIEIPNARNAVAFLSRAVELGLELGANTDDAQTKLQLAQQELDHGSLSSAYDLASQAYVKLEGNLKSKLFSNLNEINRMLATTRIQLQSVNKSVAPESLANVSIRLEADGELLALAEVDIKAGTLASYERAFRTLQTVKESLSHDQSVLAQYNTNQPPAVAQGIEQSPRVYVVVAFGVSAIVLIVAFMIWRTGLPKIRRLC